MRRKREFWIPFGEKFENLDGERCNFDLWCVMELVGGVEGEGDTVVACEPYHVVQLTNNHYNFGVEPIFLGQTKEGIYIHVWIDEAWEAL